jgi:hypothetical protein
MKTILTLFTISVLLCSCEKLFFEEDLASKDPYTSFEYLWNECNEKYSYFELKNINWDDIKTKYSAKIYEGMTQDSLFNVLAAMLAELRDGHTQLYSYFNTSVYRPYYEEQDNFDWRIIEDHYLFHKYYITGPFLHNFISNNEIGYIRIPNFPGYVRDKHVDFIFERYKDTKGLIIDLRENTGGNPNDMIKIMGPLVDSETLAAYTRIKSGPGHNDFGDLKPLYITPNGNFRYTNKVVVLTDRATFSCGSYMALFSKALPNVVLIGDTTAGGLGAPNGGQLPNGWTYRFSVTQCLTLDKSPDWENGVPPDFHVLFDWNDLTKDEVLERAIEELK